jgi:osmoprotectant transport system ATP-binding protein
MAISKKLFNTIDCVKIENVTKKYGRITAIKRINLDVCGGELLILLGPSGCGKTTLLRTINRLVEFDEGRILINGKDNRDFDPVILRKNIGYVIQQIGLFPHMTVRENIGLVPKMEGWSEVQITQKVKKLLEIVSLPPEKFMNRKPKELSGGQQQRIGLARAMVMDPPLLLMDEPFGALDPILRKQLQEEFIKIKEKLNRTIIFVTHDIEEAFRLGDRIAILKEGKLIQLAKKNELLVNPADDFIADIVDSKKKFKHLENLATSDIMISLDKKYFFEYGSSTDLVIESMVRENIELGIVMQKEKFLGYIKLQELYQKNDKNLKHFIRQSLVFKPIDSIALALSMMKEKNEFIAVIVEEKPIGILLANEILSRLI